MWYLIFHHNSGDVYIHEYETKIEAMQEYKHYNHLKEEQCRIILATGDVLNKGVN